MAHPPASLPGYPQGVGAFLSVPVLLLCAFPAFAGGVVKLAPVGLPAVASPSAGAVLAGPALVPGPFSPLSVSLPRASGMLTPEPVEVSLPRTAVALRAAVTAASLGNFKTRLGNSIAAGAPAAGLASDFRDFFDGSGPRAAAAPVEEPAEPRGGDVWRDSLFRSPDDGAVITYRARRPAGVETEAPKVFVGGMGLPDSFESYFETGREAHLSEYLLTLRGLPPTDWTHSRRIFDADARDLARMIVLAAKETGQGRVELLLHSYSTLVFQRMLQMKDDAGVNEALKYLKGSRVVFIGASTHYGDSETAAGPEYAEMARRVRAFVTWLDAMDDYADMVGRSAEINPFLAPQAYAWLALWRIQRESALAMASREAAQLLMEHLKEPWDKDIDGIRERLSSETEGISRLPGWQEGVIRRANDTSLLEFTPRDVARLRRLGVRVDVVYGARDQLIPWSSERILAGRLGMDVPTENPGAGAVYSDRSKLFRMIVVDGDHYYPLKNPRRLRRLLGE